MDAECRHCGRITDLPGRGLCWTCYSNSSIRMKYGKIRRAAPKKLVTRETEPTMEELERMIAENYDTMPGRRAGEE